MSFFMFINAIDQIESLFMAQLSTFQNYWINLTCPKESCYLWSEDDNYLFSDICRVQSIPVLHFITILWTPAAQQLSTSFSKRWVHCREWKTGRGNSTYMNVSSVWIPQRNTQIASQTNHLFTLHWRPKFSFLSQTMEAHFDSLNFNMNLFGHPSTVFILPR